MGVRNVGASVGTHRQETCGGDRVQREEKIKHGQISRILGYTGDEVRFRCVVKGPRGEKKSYS